MRQPHVGGGGGSKLIKLKFLSIMANSLLIKQDPAVLGDKHWEYGFDRPWFGSGYGSTTVLLGSSFPLQIERANIQTTLRVGDLQAVTC